MVILAPGNRILDEFRPKAITETRKAIIGIVDPKREGEYRALNDSWP